MQDFKNRTRGGREPIVAVRNVQRARECSLARDIELVEHGGRIELDLQRAGRRLLVGTVDRERAQHIGRDNTCRKPGCNRATVANLAGNRAVPLHHTARTDGQQIVHGRDAAVGNNQVAAADHADVKALGVVPLRAGTDNADTSVARRGEANLAGAARDVRAARDRQHRIGFVTDK